MVDYTRRTTSPKKSMPPLFQFPSTHANRRCYRSILFLPRRQRSCWRPGIISCNWSTNLGFGIRTPAVRQHSLRMMHEHTIRVSLCPCVACAIFVWLAGYFLFRVVVPVLLQLLEKAARWGWLIYHLRLGVGCCNLRFGKNSSVCLCG